MPKLSAKPQPQLPADMLEKAAHVSKLMRVLSHPQRLCLLCHLSEKAHTVTELVEQCHLPQPQVSQFLARLKTEGLVEATREGRQQIYMLADPTVLKVMQALSGIFCAK